METASVVIFDDACALCRGAARFITGRDKRRQFEVVGSGSREARLLAGAQGCDADASLVLVEGGRPYTKSTAFLRTAGRLGWPWRLARVLLLVPSPLRDAAYDVVARHRHRLFGRSAK